MKPASVFAVLGVVALAGCEPVGPGPGPGWGGPPPGTGWGRPPPVRVDPARAERACVAEAQRQGLRVRSAGRPEIVTGSRGRVIGAQTVLRVSRGGRSYPVLCSYTFDSRIARITPIRRG